MDLTKAQSNDWSATIFGPKESIRVPVPGKNTLRKKSACPRQKINEKKAIKLPETFEYKPKNMLKG